MSSNSSSSGGGEDQGGDLASLVRLAALQVEAGDALRQLAVAGSGVGGEVPTSEQFERYLDLARRLLRDVLGFGAPSSASFDPEAFAQPLVTQLSIYADHRQWARDHDGAAALRAEADDLFARFLGSLAAADVRRTRAMQAAAEGRFHDAINGLADAHRVFSETGRKLDALQAQIDLANIHEWLGDHERALTSLAEAHTVATELEGRPASTGAVMRAVTSQLRSIVRGKPTKVGEDALALRHVAYNIIQAEARNRRLLGDLVEAERLFLQARPFLASMGLTAGVDYHLAVIASARGDLGRAEAILAEIEPAFETPMIRPRKAALRLVQADVLLARGEPEQALDLVEDGLADQSAYPDLDLGWKLDWRRAKVLSALGRPDDATAAHRSGMTHADRLRMTPLGYCLDRTFFRDKLPMANEAIDLCLERGDAEGVVWCIEMVKSWALSATLSVPRELEDGQVEGVGDRLGEDEAVFDHLSRRIDALAFARYAGNAEAGALRQRVALLKERDSLLETMRQKDPRWRALREPAPFDIAATCTRLGSGRAALVLFHRPGLVVSAVLDAAGAVVGRRKLSTYTSAALTSFADNLRKPQPDEFLFDFSDETGVGLQDLVPDDVLARLSGASTLIVVPHLHLHLLPWACMDMNGSRVFETHAVGQLPSLASLAAVDLDPLKAPGAALIGAADYTGLTMYPALTEATEEIDDVASIYGDSVVGQPRMAEAATEAAFWELTEESAAGHAVLHFSGHGNVEAAEPLACGLLLTRSTVDAAEILSTPVRFPEVVLSGCSTGWRPGSTRGLELVGDDALGLPASFLESGARFLLASIPPVREKAARIFTVSWHRKRHAGASPLEAYCEVQREQHAAAPELTRTWAGMTAFGSR